MVLIVYFYVLAYIYISLFLLFYIIIQQIMDIFNLLHTVLNLHSSKCNLNNVFKIRLTVVQRKSWTVHSIPAWSHGDRAMIMIAVFVQWHTYLNHIDVLNISVWQKINTGFFNQVYQNKITVERPWKHWRKLNKLSLCRMNIQYLFFSFWN